MSAEPSHPFGLEELGASFGAGSQWWSTLLEAVGVGMLVSDHHADVVAVTSTFAAMLRRSEADIKALGIAGITHPEDLPANLTELHRFHAGEIDEYHLDKRYLRGDGSVMWGRLAVTAVPSPDRSERWAVGAVVDITDRHDLEERLRRFAAEASHELRGPAATILATAQLLQTPLEEDDRQELITMLVRRAERLQQVAGGMLDLGRAEAGTPATAVELIRLRDAAAEAVEDVGLAGGDVDLALEDVTLRVNGAGLQQLLRNLLVNAAQHGRPPVTIRGRRDGGEAVIEVRDHGPGLSRRSVEHLYQPFARAARGVGLGLSISRSLARAMGGTLEYERADPGARFLLRLPAATDDPPQP